MNSRLEREQVLQTYFRLITRAVSQRVGLATRIEPEGIIHLYLAETMHRSLLNHFELFVIPAARDILPIMTRFFKIMACIIDQPAAR